MAEIAVARSRLGRDDCHALRQQGHRQFLVEVDGSLCLQPHEDFAPASRHIAQRVGGVDVLHHVGEAIELVERHRHQQLNVDACCKGLPRGLLEVGT